MKYLLSIFIIGYIVNFHYGWIEPIGSIIYEMDYFPYAIYVDDIIVFALYFFFLFYKKITPQELEADQNRDSEKRKGWPFID